MNCPYCNKEFKPKTKLHKFCSKKCGSDYRNHNGISQAKVRENKHKAFIKEMLNISDNVISIPVNGGRK